MPCRLGGCLCSEIRSRRSAKDMLTKLRLRAWAIPRWHTQDAIQGELPNKNRHSGAYAGTWIVLP